MATASKQLLYAYQKRWVKDRARFKIGKWARQIGKTFSTTLEIVDDAFEAWAKKRKTRWVILSRGERQAKEAIDEGVVLHCKAYKLAIEDILASEYRVRREDGTEVSYKQLEVCLPYGTRITALPANPDTARGFSANAMLDEFAFHADSRKIWGALFPVISKGYRLRVVSTPNGKGNKFYELMTDQKLEGVWSRHEVDIYRAVKEGCPRNIEELRAGLNDEDLWAQEYELKWLDEASAWLPYELIDGVEDDKAGKPELYAGGPVFVGEDIGIRRNLYVLWVLELVGDVLWTREVIARKGIKFAEIDAIRADVFARYRVLRDCIDQTGMGEKVVEDAQGRHGNLRVEGVLFTAANKVILANAGKEAFEDRKIRIPLGERDLRQDLHKLKRVVGPTGAPRFLAEDDEQGHADRAWACFLAINAAAGPRAPIEFQSTGQTRFGASIDDARAGGVDADRGFGVALGRGDFRGYE